MVRITIWDTNAERIAEIDRNLHLAMQELGIKGATRSISEPPLLARESLLDRVPVLEIAGRHWSLTPNTTITQKLCRELLRMLLQPPR